MNVNHSGPSPLQCEKFQISFSMCNLHLAHLFHWNLELNHEWNLKYVVKIVDAV